MEFDKVVRKRASIRKFALTKKVKTEEVMEAIEAAHLAPSPGNLNILTFVVVSEKEKILKIATACQQRFLENAQHLVVICSDSSKAKDFYEDRAEKYVKQHAGAAIENFLLKITEIGLASCWIGAFSDVTIKNLLNIPDNLDVEAVLPVAYEFTKDLTKQREKLSLNNKVFFNFWKNKFSVPYTKVRREDV